MLRIRVSPNAERARMMSAITVLGLKLLLAWLGIVCNAMLFFYFEGEYKFLTENETYGDDNFPFNIP